MAIIFPDIEPVIVAHLVDRLADIDDPIATDVRVGTIKLPPGSEASKEVIVTASYGTTLQHMVREASAVIEVYADDYETASELALLVGAIITQIPHDPIKRAIVTVGPVRTTEEPPREKRTLSVDFTVKGTDF
ncbi:MAG TPA: hypothetical protein VK149_04345 [Sideroxyarcus sp.]|nr:hypothetical protein [Sideroxyarcus sp.]